MSCPPPRFPNATRPPGRAPPWPAHCTPQKWEKRTQATQAIRGARFRQCGRTTSEWTGGDAALADHAIDPDVDKIHCFLRGKFCRWELRAAETASNSSLFPIELKPKAARFRSWFAVPPLLFFPLHIVTFPPLKTLPSCWLLLWLLLLQLLFFLGVRLSLTHSNTGEEEPKERTRGKRIGARTQPSSLELLRNISPYPYTQTNRRNGTDKRPDSDAWRGR